MPKPQPKPTTPAPKPAEKPATMAPDPTKPAKPENDRLTIPIGKDGRPDFESMRDKTKARIRQVLSDPETARALGLQTEPAGPPVSTIPPFLTVALLSTINQFQTIIIARMTQAPADILIPIAKYSRDEQDAILPPLDAVLNKYGGPIASKYGPEIALLGLLTALTLQKVEAVRAAMAEHTARRPAVVVPHPSAPAPAADVPRDEPSAAEKAAHPSDRHVDPIPPEVIQ